MDNYKIKVKDEAESKEAQELFFELGYSWLCCGKYYNRIGNYTFITAYPDEMLLRMGWGGDTDKELTLPQLRDLVVLKRNDVKDATHVDPGGTKHVEIDGRWHWFHEESTPDIQFGWVESAAYREYDDNVLKPINQTQDPALISGADVPRLIKDGNQIQLRAAIGFKLGEWKDLDLERDEEEFSLGDLINTRFEWRLKPQTIKLELELPKPFEPKDNDWVWTISGVQEGGITQMLHRDGNDYPLGAWRTEEEVKQVVEQLRKIRGTNS